VGPTDADTVGLGPRLRALHPMRTRRRTTIEQLRTAIDSLPVSTRVAMLEGIRANDIIVGAYSAGGGVCPMLAAHRAGGRTNFIGFAKAWDRFAFAHSRVTVARRATRRELLVLVSHLEASLLERDGPAPDLRAAVDDHRRLLVERERRAEAPEVALPRPRRPGDRDRDRGAELATWPGWAWMRVFRRYDDYARALDRVQAEQNALGQPRAPEFVA
jgi:hypothetical protein